MRCRFHILRRAVRANGSDTGRSGWSVSAVGTLSTSDCYPVGPAGPYVAGGPVSPDVGFTNPELVTHTVLVYADPAGQDVSAVGTPSQSDCYPAGPAGPYVAVALLAQMIIYKF